MKGVKIFLADGFEDMEAISTRDILVRGGVDVETVSLREEDPFVVSSHGLTVVADLDRSCFQDAGGASRNDVMIFPGGMPGSKTLSEDKELMALFDEAGISLQNGWRKNTETGENHLCGIPQNKLPGLSRYATATDGYLCVIVNGGNDANALKFLRILCRDMLAKK